MNGMILYPTHDDIVALNRAIKRVELWEAFDKIGIQVEGIEKGIKSGYETKMLIFAGLYKPLKINETVLG